MAEEINLKNPGGGERNKRTQEVKDAMKTIFADEGRDSEKLELLQSIIDKSEVQFSSVAKEVKVDFHRFVRLVQSHDLSAMLHTAAQVEGGENVEKQEVSPLLSQTVTISSDLLTDLSNTPLLEEEEEPNILTGIFIYGALFGVIAFLTVAIFAVYFKLSVGIRDMIIALLGILLFASIPIFVVMLEPYLRGLQQKHNDIFRKVGTIFGGKLR